MTAVAVKVDCSDLIAWARQLTEKDIRAALRNGLNSAAGKARTIAVKEIAADLNVDKSIVLKSTDRKLTKATTGNLTAKWTTRKQRISILETRGASVVVPMGLSAKQFVHTGGGSSSLHVQRAFIGRGKNSGKQLVFYRRGKGRYPLKAIYASHPAAAFGQDGGASQKLWRQTVDRLLLDAINVRLQQALNRQGISPESTSDD